MSVTMTPDAADRIQSFIVNRGKASSSDVLGLIDHIRREAKAQREINLETEVQIIGDDEFTF